MIIHNCQQGSKEWFSVRKGKVTASCFSKAIAGGQGKTRNAYMIQLLAEMMTDEIVETYTNGAMERGSEIEPFARDYYERMNNCMVEDVGFVELNEDVGASPDGIIGDDGIVEIKCPNSTTHIQNILSDKMPTTYIPQVQGQLWVTERKWCDFISFDPRVKNRPFWYKRILRDDEYIETLRKNIDKFVEDLKAMYAKLNESPY
jgi:putative phage-type endonuclease